MRKPFYRKSHKCWYIKNNAGKFVRLDPDEEKAFDLWNRMRELLRFDAPDATVAAICEAFLTEYESSLTEERYTKAVTFCTSFCDFVGPSFEARHIAKSDVRNWLDAPRTIRGQKGAQWSVARKRDAGQAIKRVYRWAFNEGYLVRNQLAELRLEGPRPREHLVSPDVHAMLVEECRNADRSKAFGLFLIACHCGARPIQVRQVTAADVSPCRTMWVFRSHKTVKKTGKPLVVYLPPCLQTLTRILLTKREGNLFVNGLGEPYSKDAVVHRLARMREKLKITGVITYSYRHTYATDAMLAGNDIGTVAALLGHSDAAMVSRVYGHLDQNAKHMHSAAAKTAAMRHSQKDPSS